MGIFTKTVAVTVLPKQDNYLTGMHHNGDPETRKLVEPLMWDTFNRENPPGEYMIVERSDCTDIYDRDAWELGEGQQRPYHLAMSHTKK